MFEDVLTEVASLVLDQIQEAHRKYGKPPKVRTIPCHSHPPDLAC